MTEIEAKIVLNRYMSEYHNAPIGTHELELATAINALLSKTDLLDNAIKQLNMMNKDNQPKGLFRKSNGKLEQGNIEHEVKIRQQVIEYIISLLEN